jgi:hypothetical protein
MELFDSPRLLVIGHIIVLQTLRDMVGLNVRVGDEDLIVSICFILNV